MRARGIAAAGLDRPRRRPVGWWLLADCLAHRLEHGHPRIGLIRGIDADPARQALIAGMGYFALKRKVRLIAERIETAEKLAALRALAVPYGQAYLLGRDQDGRGPGPWPTRISLSTNDSGQG